MPGDQIQMRDGLLYINGQPVKDVKVGEDHRALWPRHSAPGEPGPGDPAERQTFMRQDIVPNVYDAEYVTKLDNTGIYAVPPHEYFMMGDNRRQFRRQPRRRRASCPRPTSKAGADGPVLLVVRAPRSGSRGPGSPSCVPSRFFKPLVTEIAARRRGRQPRAPPRVTLSRPLAAGARPDPRQRRRRRAARWRDNERAGVPRRPGDRACWPPRRCSAADPEAAPKASCRRGCTRWSAARPAPRSAARLGVGRALRLAGSGDQGAAAATSSHPGRRLRGGDGAVYLDGGPRGGARGLPGPLGESSSASPTRSPARIRRPRLQEWAQAPAGRLPAYAVVGRSGPRPRAACSRSRSRSRASSRRRPTAARARRRKRPPRAALLEREGQP